MGALPSQETANKLATLIAKHRKRMGKGEPFPFFDISDFVPDWCGARGPTTAKLPTTLAAWLAGFQDFALAADADIGPASSSLPLMEEEAATMHAVPQKRYEIAVVGFMVLGESRS